MKSIAFRAIRSGHRNIPSLLLCAPSRFGILHQQAACLEKGHFGYYSISRRIQSTRRAFSTSQAAPSPFVNYLTSDGSRITEVHRHAQANLPVVDRVLEPQTILLFCEFCSHGTLPNGKKTTPPRPSEDDLNSINSPWDKWATSAHNNCGESTFQLVVKRTGSFEDDGRLSCVGILPISDTQWRAKELGDPENFDLATQHLSSVVAVFEYLNSPAVMDNIRETFNLISENFRDFDTAISVVREVHKQDPISMVALWEEYMFARYQVMTTRAHSWVISHVDALREPILHELRSHQPPSKTQVSAKQMELTDKIQVLGGIAACSDFGIIMPMEGYTGYNSPTEIEISDLKSREWDVRREAHRERTVIVTRVIFLEDEFKYPDRWVDSDYLSDPQEFVRFSRFQAEALEEIRIEMRGDPVRLPEEEWIARNLRYMEKDSVLGGGFGPGLDVYRLTYNQTDAEWADFVQKVEAAVENWGDGISDADKIKRLLKLRWRNGKELGIPQGDIEAARKHFQNNGSEQLYPLLTTFLVIDDASFNSFMTDAYTTPAGAELPLLAGDFGPFIVAVDMTYDPSNPDPRGRTHEHPGYKGHMRIQPGLVWGDLYAMLSTPSAYLGHLWPLAMDHPNQVYTGVIAPVQVAAWWKFNLDSTGMSNSLKTFFKRIGWQN